MLGIAALTYLEGESINLSDARTHPKFSANIDERPRHVTTSLLSIPVRDPSGKIVAVLQVSNKVVDASAKAGLQLTLIQEDEQVARTITL